MTFTALDLFAGIGGFSRAVHWLGGTTVGFVEWDAWNRRVLAKHWPEAQFHGDIRTLTADTLRSWGIRTYDGVGLAHSDQQRPQRSQRAEQDGGTGRSRLGLTERDARQSIGEPESQLDLLTGGYPCQPFSHAGKRLGAADDRHLWPEMRRVLNLTRPRWMLAENVAGHIGMGLDTVLAELEADGYTAGAVVVPACAVNALHRRDRVWIMAHAESGERLPGHEADAIIHRGQARLEHSGSGSRFGESGTTPQLADAAARGLRRGRAPGHDGQPAQRGEGVPNADSIRHEGWEGDPSVQQHRTGRTALGEPEPPDRAQDAEGPKAPRPVDPRTDGLRPGPLRRPAARSAWDDPDVIRAMWADGSWEADLPRVVAEEAERRQKLQAAGNAIVPIVAYEILKAMMFGEEG